MTEQTKAQEIKGKYGFVYDDDTCNLAFEYAKLNLLNEGYYQEVKEFHSPSTQFIIPNFVADRDFSDIVDKNDITVEQYQKVAPYGYADISSNITTVTFSHPSGNTIVNMSTTYPTDATYTVKISYCRVISKYTTLIPYINQLLDLYFIEYLFKTLDPYKLQQGMTTKTLNGVDITYDAEAISKYQKKLKSQITELIINLQGFGLDNDLNNIQFSKGYKR